MLNNNLIKGRWHELKIDFRNKKISEEIKIQGNYAIYVDNQLRYIGSTKNLVKRLNQHILFLKSFLPEYLNIKIKIRPEKKSEKFNLERNLIIKLKPPGNFNDFKKIKYNSIEIIENIIKIKNETDLDNKDLASCGLSKRTINALTIYGSKKLKDLKEEIKRGGLESLYLYRGFGQACMQEIISLLGEN